MLHSVLNAHKQGGDDTACAAVLLTAEQLET